MYAVYLLVLVSPQILKVLLSILENFVALLVAKFCVLGSFVLTSSSHQ